MARRLTETFDPMDFLEFASAGQMQILTGTVDGDTGGVDFEAWMNTSNNVFPGVYIFSDFPGEITLGVFLNRQLSFLTTHDLIKFKSDDTVLGILRNNSANAKLELVVNGVVEAIGTVNLQYHKDWHVQVRFKVDSSSGVFECKLDEDLDVMTFNGNTRNAGAVYCNRIEFGPSQTYFDSLYINDTQDTGEGSTGYDGVVRMKSFVPTNDGFWEEWALTTGVNGYAMLNSTPHDSDTTIISSSTNGQKSSFVAPGHGLIAPSVIKAISARWVVRKVSDGRVRPFFRINSTDYPIALASVPVGVGYGVVMDRRVENPDTSAPWDLSDTIDSFGLESVL